MGHFKWYVITGAPSSGKTTIVSRLSKMGYHTLFEAARLLIEKEISEGKSLEEIRINEIEFQRKILELKIELESKLPKDKIVFLDRAIPDTIAYYQLYGTDTNEVLKICQIKKYKKIFLLEPLSFEKDHVRIENEKTAKKLSELIKKAYMDLGYEVINVPIMPIEDRINFILSNL
ncbi:MAG: AAA family ATPase [Candidatus Aenigmarchaeota archaeon]|nr:AAA family ATPase [Candidatus Aenigmarchaeota archaeon]